MMTYKIVMEAELEDEQAQKKAAGRIREKLFLVGLTFPELKNIRLKKITEEEEN